MSIYPLMILGIYFLQGYRVTKQGTSMIRTSWKAVIPENRLPPYLSDNDQGLGIQIAQLGLEASAAVFIFLH